MDVAIARLPRGIRTNNPGNIRRGAAAWRGARAEPGDPSFEAFEAPEYGIRALARLLLTYYRMRRLRTVGAILSRYAPPAENDTLSYVAHVSRALGVAPDALIDLEDHETLLRFIKTVIRHENGRKPDGSDWYEDDVIRNGIDLAMQS